MIHNFIYRIIRRRHFWRHATFSEVAELYTSRLLRVLALHMVSLFMALYLYKNGFSLLFIAFYYAAYFCLKIVISWPSAVFAARFGPKHGILISNFLYIPALIAFVCVPEFGIAAVIVFGFFQAISATLYDLCYQIDFSKVKHADHAGKEIGFMSFIEKLASGLSPLIGGIIATLFGAHVTIWIAAVLFAVSAGPLMKTAEPLKTGLPIKFRGFPWRASLAVARTEAVRGFDFVTTSTIWILFLAVVIFGAAGDDIYVKIGALSSIGFLITFVAAFTFGRLIDRRHGRALLRCGVLMKSLTHLLRPVVGMPVHAAAINMASETATTGYYMAYLRGVFDEADRSGSRIVYLFILELAVNFGAAFACVLFGMLIWVFDAKTGMSIFFVVAAAVSLLLMTSRFTLYRK